MTSLVSKTYPFTPKTTTFPRIYWGHCSSPITTQTPPRAATLPLHTQHRGLSQVPLHSPTLWAVGDTRGTWVDACLMVLMLDSRRRGCTAALRMGVAEGYAAGEMEHS